MNELNDELIKSLQNIITSNNMDDYRAFIKRTAKTLGVNYLECAAALACLHQSTAGSQNKQGKGQNTHSANHARKMSKQVNGLRMVCYRLEIGRKHQVALETLKKMLVDETGVEKKQIGYIDMHNYYTLIKLPEGMPNDIFNHLKTVQINQQVLCVKRLGKNPNKNKKTNEKKPVNHRVQRTIQGKVRSNAMHKNIQEQPKPMAQKSS